MSDLTQEQRDELRRLHEAVNNNIFCEEIADFWQKMCHALPVLLDAADERDRLRAENERLQSLLGQVPARIEDAQEHGWVDTTRRFRKPPQIDSARKMSASLRRKLAGYIHEVEKALGGNDTHQPYGDLAEDVIHEPRTELAAERRKVENLQCALLGERQRSEWAEAGCHELFDNIKNKREQKERLIDRAQRAEAACAEKDEKINAAITNLESLAEIHALGIDKDWGLQCSAQAQSLRTVLSPTPAAPVPSAWSGIGRR